MPEENIGNVDSKIGMFEKYSIFRAFIAQQLYKEKFYQFPYRGLFPLSSTFYHQMMT